MFGKLLFITAILLLPITSFAQARLLRHPSYSHGQIAFSYGGDIWIANDNGSAVRRLTDHKARDVFLRFSPDGSQVAFSSSRDGNNDIFVIPTQGGKPAKRVLGRRACNKPVQPET